MSRILLVCDEASTSSARFAAQAGWELLEVRGAAAAQAQLRNGRWDAIVADLIQGAVELLEQARRQQPQAARFLLCGQINVENMHRAMAVAHQVYPGDGDPRLQQRSIDRVCSLARRGKVGTQRVLGMLGRLPVLPRIYWELAGELERPLSDSASVAAIIEQDPATSARVLQLANSAFFGSSRQISVVRDAATLLGLEPLRSIALLAGLSRAVHASDLPRSFSLDQFQAHAIRVARQAAAMVNDPLESKLAYSAGMLHHIGKLMLAVNLPEDYEALRQAAFAASTTTDQVETSVLGCDHAEIGALILGLWGLPLPLVEVVANHHHPSRAGEMRFGAVTAVHVASILAEEAQGQLRQSDSLDLPHLRRLGVETAVQRWRNGAAIAGL